MSFSYITHSSFLSIISRSFCAMEVGGQRHARTQALAQDMTIAKREEDVT
jgi:hypothetical protein